MLPRHTTAGKLYQNCDANEVKFHLLIIPVSLRRNDVSSLVKAACHKLPCGTHIQFLDSDDEKETGAEGFTTETVLNDSIERAGSGAVHELPLEVATEGDDNGVLNDEGAVISKLKARKEERKRNVSRIVENMPTDACIP